MEERKLYSIGHGTRSAKDFMALLKEFGIEYLIDVRSQPYSKYNPQYNQNELKNLLEGNGIRYVFMGDSIGGRPKDVTCYDIEGNVDYKILNTKEFFKEGIQRLKTAYNKNIPAAIMCSESKPENCHRSKLIGKELNNDNIVLMHIDENGKIKDQTTVINEVNKGLDFPKFDFD
jgi:uncharacterized protein (DUF488 family)